MFDVLLTSLVPPPPDTDGFAFFLDFETLVFGSRVLMRRPSKKKKKLWSGPNRDFLDGFPYNDAASTMLDYREKATLQHTSIDNDVRWDVLRSASISFFLNRFEIRLLAVLNSSGIHGKFQLLT